MTEKKSIKVTPIVHEELQARKYQNESIDDVLRRHFDMVPSIEDLTASLPTRLAEATIMLVEDHIDEQQRYDQISERESASETLRFLSRTTEREIFRVTISAPDPPSRINSRVRIKYRDPSGTAERTLGVELRDTEDNAIDIRYRDSESLEMMENTRRGEDAAEKTAADFGEHIADLVERAYQRWGE